MVGLAILATLFLVDFSDSKSLWAQAHPLLSNISAISSMGLTGGQVAYDYIIMICFIILLIAGLVGFFPLGSGVLGIVAMAMLSVAPVIIVLGSYQPSYDTGFYLLWVESIVVLAASFMHGRGDRKVVTQTTQASPPPAPAQPSS